jgi:membrane protease YdiL (CAAX protease family)
MLLIEMQRMPPSSSRIVGVCLAAVATLYLSWTVAWLLAGAMMEHCGWLTTDGSRTGYWTLMKALLWVLPSVLLIRYSGRTVRQTISAKSVGTALAWGVGVGLLIGLEALVRKCLAHHALSISLSWGFLNATVIAPIVEEFTFRGAVLGSLMRRYRFATANTATAFLFLFSHFPGWYFQGTLWNNIAHPIGGVGSIFLLGWVFGFAVHKSNSVVGGVIAHSVNNFFSQL